MEMTHYRNVQNKANGRVDRSLPPVVLVSLKFVFEKEAEENLKLSHKCVYIFVRKKSQPGRLLEPIIGCCCFIWLSLK